MKTQRSLEIMERARKRIPGGVNSPVRAWGYVGGSPLVFARGEGAYLFDADENQFIDYVCSWGPLIFGHADAEILAEVVTTSVLGTSFGAPTEREVQLAELLSELVPSLEMSRMVSSGTEAVMSAVRLARAATGRSYIIKFDGCYHGHADAMLVQAGSGAATLGIAATPGIPEQTAQLTLSVEYNDAAAVERAIEAVGAQQVAAIIVEPVAGNMGLVLPERNFLPSLRQLADKFGIVLIFDEVMSGFRVALGGAQYRYSVRPDLTTLGKVVGGGLPAAVFGGKKELMEQLAPLGNVYQAGTLSGNPLAVTAGLATLRKLVWVNPFAAFEETAVKLIQGLKEAAVKNGVPFNGVACGSMFGFFLSNDLVRNFSEAKLASNSERYARFFHGMIKEGIYLPPSPFEACFLSTEHSAEIIDRTVSAAEKVFKHLN